MNRFHETDALAATVRAEIPRAAIRWLAAVRTPLEVLTTAALDEAVTDAEFLALVEKFSAEIPGLMDTMDHDALGELMAGGMGAAMGNGIASRSVGVSPTRPIKAKLPWETEAWLAGNPNHDSKDGRFTHGPGGNQLSSPTGRTIHFAEKISEKIKDAWPKKDKVRQRFLHEAKAAIHSPDEVWEHGTFVIHIKKLTRLSMVVHTRRFSETDETVESFIPMKPSRIKRRGQKIWPRP